MSTNRRRPTRRHSKSFKLQVLQERREGALTVKALSEKHGLHHSLIYRWERQYREHGEAGLENRSPVPKTRPRQTPPAVQRQVVEAKEGHPTLGSQALRDHLERFTGLRLSTPTVNRILRRFGFAKAPEILAERARANFPEKARKHLEELEQEARGWRRFERPRPNDLWQTDLATFFLRGGTQVWLIMVLDDHSRFIVNWGAYRRAKADHVIEVLTGAMARYGLPTEILTDRGAQFVSWQGVTRFQKLLGKLGVAHVKARAHHPQTLGKQEATWRNLQRELLDVELFRSFEEAVQRIGDWVEHYNHARTHQGIGGFTPADRYFGIAEAVQAHLEEARRQRQQGVPEQVQVARASLGYLVGRMFGHEVRLEEAGGRITLHLDGKPARTVDLVPVTRDL